MDVSPTIRLGARVVIALKFLGFGSITIINGKSVTTLTDLLCLLASISLGVFIIYLSVVSKKVFAQSTSPIADLGNFVSYIAAINVSIVSMISVFYWRHRIWQMVLTLAAIEDKFAEINFYVDYSKELKGTILVSFLITLIILPLSCSLFMMDAGILKILLYIYGSLYFLFNLISATIFILGAVVRLFSMREYLTRMLNSSHDKITDVKCSVADDRVEAYATLADTYNELLNFCDEINVCFGFQLMISFGLIFFYTLFTSFSAFVDFANEGYLTDVVISSISFCAYFNFVLLMIIFACYLVERQVRVITFRQRQFSISNLSPSTGERNLKTVGCLDKQSKGSRGSIDASIVQLVGSG